MKLRTKRETENFRNISFKTKIWLENSDKNKALYGTRAEVREWTAKMKNAIEDCQNFYEQNEDYKKILLSVGNNTEEALREAHEFPRFEAGNG